MFRMLNYIKNETGEGLGVLLKASLVLSLIINSVAFANEELDSPYWLFPGETLPGEKAIFPMSVGVDASSDVVVSSRDWFLLKPAELVYGKQIENNPGVNLGYQGPKLNSYNAQMYYRLVTGMVLKETLSQMGVSSFESKRYFDSAKERGLDFDKVPLAELGALPPVLQNLYINFQRPAAREALLPYLITPLAIAVHQSDLRHFTQTESKSDFSEKCVDWSSQTPMVWNSAERTAKKNELDGLHRAYQDALSLQKTSDLEVVRLTQALTQRVEEETLKTKCLNKLKDFVNKGLVLPEADCIEVVKNIVTDETDSDAWTKFEEGNLKNLEGDFVSLQKAQTALETFEARQVLIVSSAESLLKTEQEVAAALTKNQESFNNLQIEAGKQNIKITNLISAHENMKVELLSLQQINADLDQGSYQESRTEEEVLKAISETSNRQRQISELKIQIEVNLEEQSKVQGLQAVVDTQINFLNQEIESKKTQLTALESSKSEQSLVSADEVEAERRSLESNLKISQDAYRYADYILSLISKNVYSVESEKNALSLQLASEKEAVVAYKEQAENLKFLNDSELPKLEEEYKSATEAVGPYTSDEKMAWYLDQECESRSSKSVFLSRSQMSENINEVGGKWGMFSLDYSYYQNSLNSGLALNLSNYISFAVQKIISHYDLMSVESYSPSSNCQDITNESFLAHQDRIVATHSMWVGGSQASLENTGFCKVRTEEASSFRRSFEKLIDYTNSLLDISLPQIGVHNPQITLEREAYYWLTQELQVLAGKDTAVDLVDRREGLIKALIKVSANDYKKESLEEGGVGTDNRTVQIATQAPGAELYRAKSLDIGSLQNVNTIGKIELYSAPIEEDTYKTEVALSLNDKVEVMEISDDFPGESVKASWVKVLVKSERLSRLQNQEFWMPAWPLTYDKFVSATGTDVYPNMSEVNCPDKRVVKEITNFQNSDKYISRFLPEIQTTEYKDNLWQISWSDNTKTSPAYTDRGTYIACETFSVVGQKTAENISSEYQNSEIDYTEVQGVRIISVDLIKDVNGKVYYIPTENYGGFVHTWIPGRNAQRPRIVLGKKIGSDWSEVE